MSKKHHGGPGPVPAGNQPHTGTSFTPATEEAQPGDVRKDGEVPAQQADPKHRIGRFNGTADHSIQQPDGKNGANH